MDLTKDQLEGLSLALDESNLLDISVDPILWQATAVFEVLTLPKDELPPKDRIVNFIINRIVRIAASLTKTTDGGSKRLGVLPLTLDKLEETAKSFNGLSIYGADFIQENSINALPDWFPYVSFDVRNDVADGKIYTFDLFQVTDNRCLDIRIWFQELRLEKNGESLDMKEFIEDGKRWWEAFNKDSFRTHGYGIIPLKDPPKEIPPKSDQ